MKSAIVAGLKLNETEECWEQKMTEMVRLCEACGIEIRGELVQKGLRAQPKTLLGSGKCEQLKALIAETEAEGAVFLNELSGIQLRNLEQICQAEICDRSAVILEIFGRHARTRQARLQVQAAQLAYQLPRLIQGQIHADQQQGGGVRNRGAGETRLERSRRTIEKQIHEVRRKLDVLQRQHQTQSRRRSRSGLPQVCLIGYSNAGKSSLMNALLNDQGSPEAKQVLQQDQLFATLDSTVRRIRLLQGQELLLSDTVGFVRDLPGFLLEAFESTLQEIDDADLLIEVIDAADEQWPLQHEIVLETLQRLQALSVPRIKVYNKTDLTPQWDRTDGLAISCLSGKGLEALRLQLAETLASPACKPAASGPENQDEISREVGYNDEKRGE